MNNVAKTQLPIIIAPEYSSFAKAVYLLCEIRNIPYEKAQQHNGEEVSFYSDKLHQLNPWNKLPLMQHNDLIIGESIAIARYLNELNDDTLNLFGVDEINKAKIEYWLHAISIYVDQFIIRNIVLEFAFPKGNDGQVRMEVVYENLEPLKQCLSTLDHQIKNHYVMDNRLTICDIFLIPMLAYLANMPEEVNLIGDFKKVEGYLNFHKQQDYFSKIF